MVGASAPAKIQSQTLQSSLTSDIELFRDRHIKEDTCNPSFLLVSVLAILMLWGEMSYKNTISPRFVCHKQLQSTFHI